jgi:predicted amidohydrolase YtcJ
VPNAQPLWACNERQMRELTIPFFGAERTRHQYPFASLRRSGATLAFGSDWPVSTPDPLQEIEVAVTRVPPDERDLDPLVPEERLDLPAALDAFTIGSAYVLHSDAETGSLETGKLADLAVIDRDILASDGGNIGDAGVVLTLVEGEPVYDRDGLLA